MAAEDRGAPGRVVDVVATVLLAIVGVLVGAGYGSLALIAVPVDPVWFWWAVTGVAIVFGPLATAVVGFVRLARRRRAAFLAPLVGVGIVVLGIALLTAMSQSLVSA